ncbi:manganese efflux pump MntP [[Eubacterium] cellulosolvens]
MNFITIIFIAIGLAMDAFAVAITCGIKINHQKFQNALKIALFFGSFQAFMPVLGWLAGASFQDLIEDIDHWVAFGLLTLIGSRMIFESFRREPGKGQIKELTNYVLLTLAVATSIDALAVGISFAFLNISILIPALIIGIITFVISFTGVYIGHKLGKYFGTKMGLIGGLILIIIGINILIEHLGV